MADTLPERLARPPCLRQAPACQARIASGGQSSMITGAHNPRYLRAPDLATVAGWSPETGVRLVTLAPEVPGALDVISNLVSRSVLVSLGHCSPRTCASARRLPGVQSPIARRAAPLAGARSFLTE
jgi:hypothetical protein